MPDTGSDKTAPSSTAQAGSQSRTGAPTDSAPPAQESNEPEDFTHYVHLADGSVQKVDVSEPLGSHLVPEGEDATGGHAIIGVYPR